jgi:membrane protease YdiL (CAAX protease family)
VQQRWPAPVQQWPGTGGGAIQPSTDQRRMSSRAVSLTLTAIGVGAVAMGVSYLLSRDTSMSPATYLRYALVLTLAVYAVVGVLVVGAILPGVRLRWHDNRPALGMAVGLIVGGGLSGLLLAIVSAAAGHLAPDPRIVTLMSEGDAPHVIAAVLISCVAAPLVEEILFRGLLLESQRWRGVTPAIWLSALGFAVWHLNPSALKYYALLGALLGWLYTRYGLVGSMAAHLGFNGVLTVAALSVVFTPMSAAHVGALTVRLPAGWHQVTDTHLPSVGGAVPAGFSGPSGAGVVVLSMPTPAAPDVDSLFARLDSGGFGALDRSSLRDLRLPAGRAAEVDLLAGAQRATLVLLPHAGFSYELVLQAAGSAKARNDFSQMLRNLTIDGG